MDLIDHATAASERLSATGSREPVWVRLPEEPPVGEGLPPHYRLVPGAEARADGAVAPHRSRRGIGWIQTIVAALLGAALALGAFLLLQEDASPEPAAAAPAVTVPATPAPTLPQSEPDAPAPQVPITGTADTVAIGEAVIPSIVTVQVGVDGALQGSGSGVILDTAGHIVTNDHVVASGSAFQVVLSDGRTTYDATLVGTDPLTDLAVLKIEADSLTPIVLGDTTTLRVGDTAVAVGSPLGLEGGPSLTVGVVSAFGRQVQVSQQDTLYGMLQTDAPITQGSSGGALVDTQGRLIGITTAVGVSSVGVEGIGFATPVELMERVTSELIATGEVRHAFLGILGGTSFSTASDGASVAVGVQVESVEPDTGAEVAGLDAGDLITAIDGEPITTMDDLIIALRYRGAGDPIELTLDGGSQLEVTLGDRPADE